MSRTRKTSTKPAGPLRQRAQAESKSENDKVTAIGGARVPLDVTKPPREWRTARTTSRKAKAARASAPGRDVPAADAPAPVPAAATTIQAAHEPVPDLPERYHEDRAVLLVRDPHWLHAWWEVTDQRLQQTQASLGERGTIVLRLYDISCIDWDGRNHHDARDFAVERGLGSWYIEVGRPDGSFCAEIGVRAGDGRFIAMLRSNVVRMPRDSMSPQLDEEWMALDDEYARMFQLSGGGAPGRSSGELLERRIRRDLAAGGASSFGLQRKPRN